MTTPDTAERLRFLRAHAYREGSKPYTYAQLSQLLDERGISITGRALNDLFNGKVARPKNQVLAGLADIFGVDPDVFTYDASKWAEVEEWLTVSRQMLEDSKLPPTATIQDIVDRSAQRYRARKLAQEQKRLLNPSS